MNELIPATESRSVVTRPSLRAQLLRLALSLSDSRMFMTEKTFCGMLSEATSRAEALDAIATIRTEHTPATKQEIVMYLGKLSLHYWTPDFTPEQANQKFQDFCFDLADVTETELSAGCMAWRRNPANRFFPTPGMLLETIHQQGRCERMVTNAGLDAIERRLRDMGDHAEAPSKADGPRDFGSVVRMLKPAPAPSPADRKPFDRDAMVRSRNPSAEDLALLERAKARLA